MFCMSDPNQHTSRVLRSFRSHKSLKSEARRQQPEIQITHVSYNHVRKTSESSSVARSSMDSNFSRPSTSRTDISSTSSTSTIEWDPLRLHPATAAPTAPIPERRSQHELRGARSFHHLNAQQGSRSSELEIHEGFDFGFASPSGFSATRPPAVSAWSYSASPTPSMADSDAGRLEGAGPEWGDEHGLTPRPHHHYYPAGSGEDADYFIKRGSWKRRGIIFTPGMTMASEDECFDLEQ